MGSAGQGMGLRVREEAQAGKKTSITGLSVKLWILEFQPTRA